MASTLEIAGLAVGMADPAVGMADPAVGMADPAVGMANSPVVKGTVVVDGEEYYTYNGDKLFWRYQEYPIKPYGNRVLLEFNNNVVIITKFDFNPESMKQVNSAYPKATDILGCTISHYHKIRGAPCGLVGLFSNGPVYNVKSEPTRDIIDGPSTLTSLKWRTGRKGLLMIFSEIKPIPIGYTEAPLNPRRLEKYNPIIYDIRAEYKEIMKLEGKSWTDATELPSDFVLDRSVPRESILVSDTKLVAYHY